MQSQSLQLAILALNTLSPHNRALVLNEFDAHSPEHLKPEHHESVINRAVSLA